MPVSVLIVFYQTIYHPFLIYKQVILIIDSSPIVLFTYRKIDDPWIFIEIV